MRGLGLERERWRAETGVRALYVSQVRRIPRTFHNTDSRSGRRATSPSSAYHPPAPTILAGTSGVGNESTARRVASQDSDRLSRGDSTDGQWQPKFRMERDETWRPAAIPGSEWKAAVRERGR